MNEDVQVQPLVSFLVATYNRAGLLQECIRSILRQSYKNIEIIVVDDASTDRTVESLAKEFAERIKYYRNQENKGVAYSRNFALEQAGGKYIGLLDSDDLLLDPGHIKNAIKIMEPDPGIGIFTSDVYCLGLDGSKIYEKTFFETVIDHRGLKLESGVKGFEYVFCHGIHSCGAVFRKDITERIGFLNTAYKIDWDEDFFLRAAASGIRIYYSNTPAGGYRIHPGGFSRNLSQLYREKIMARRQIIKANRGLKKALGVKFYRRMADQYYCLMDAYMKENKLLSFFSTMLKAIAVYPPIIFRLMLRFPVFCARRFKVCLS